MKAKVMCSLLAVLMGIVLLASTALRAEAAPPEYWYFEILASGKGYETVSDSNPPPYPVYSEEKNSFSNVLFYLRYDRLNRLAKIVCYVESTGTWLGWPSMPAYETGASVLISTFPMYHAIHVVSTAPPNYLYAQGSMRIQFKEKNGTVTKARLKSLGMEYYQQFDNMLAGETLRMGTLKLKAKQIAQGDVPTAVLAAF